MQTITDSDSLHEYEENRKDRSDASSLSRVQRNANRLLDLMGKDTIEPRMTSKPVYALPSKDEEIHPGLEINGLEKLVVSNEALCGTSVAFLNQSSPQFGKNFDFSIGNERFIQQTPFAKETMNGLHVHKEEQMLNVPSLPLPLKFAEMLYSGSQENKERTETQCCYES